MVFDYIPYTFWDIAMWPVIVFIVFVAIYAAIAIPATIKMRKEGELQEHGESFYSLHAVTFFALSVFFVGLTTGGSYIVNEFNQNRNAVQTGVNEFYGLDITDTQARELIGYNAHQLDRTDDNVVTLGYATIISSDNEVKNVKLVRIGDEFKLVYDIKSSTLREVEKLN